MTQPTTPSNLNLQDIAEHGTDSGRGNLLGIQPYMLPSDYASARTFHAKLDGYLDAAHQIGWLNELTVVVFPEHIGTWLVIAGEKRSVHQAKTITAGVRVVVLSHVLSFARAMLSAKETDRVKASLFRVKAPEMARIYQSVFSNLSQEYAVTIVAGSILLPSPEVRNGTLMARDGELHNVSVVYGPDGSAFDDVVRKAFPIEMELPFTEPGSVSEMPVFNTAAGKLGVLVCADSWYPAAYERLQAQGADLVAVPSYLEPDGVWHGPWRGYTGAPPPQDVNPGDAKTITEGEAWRRYALAGRMPGHSMTHGINVFLRGKLWDLGSDGHTMIVTEGSLIEAQHIDGAAIVNLWLS